MKKIITVKTFETDSSNPDFIRHYLRTPDGERYTATERTTGLDAVAVGANVAVDYYERVGNNGKTYKNITHVDSLEELSAADKMTMLLQLIYAKLEEISKTMSQPPVIPPPPSRSLHQVKSNELPF